MATITNEKTKEKRITYKYTVEDHAGEIHEGKITALNEGQARQHLYEKGYLPHVLEEVATGGLNAEINLPFGGRVKQKDIAIWAKNFAVMFDASLPVTKILSILAEQTSNAKLAEITLEILHSVEDGNNLADAMQEHANTFSPMVVNMIRAGEASGALDETMRRVTAALDAEVKLRSKIKSAMTYPIAVLAMSVVMVIIMLLFIVPTFDDMFQSLGGELPLPTQMLVTASEILQVGAIPIAAGVIAFIVWWRKNKNKDWVRNFMDPLKLKLPVFGKLFQMVALSRFTRNLSTLLQSGVTILKALDIVSDTVGSVVVSRATKDVKDSVSSGKSFAEPLSQHAVFPPMVVQMTAVGEDAGNIETMLEKIAEMYDDDVNDTTDSLTSLMEPLLIAFLGVVVGGMVIALYLPMFSILDLVQ